MKKPKHTYVVLAYNESPFLEDCIKSVLNQSVNTNVIIATSTPNKFITKLSVKYNLKVIVNNKKEKGIAYDFNFAVKCIDSELITVAHQDDLYEYDYAKKMLNKYKKNKNSSIIFSDYYELKNDKKVYKNINLIIKRILLLPLKLKLGNIKFFRRMVLRFGNSIRCPAVTFVTNNTPDDVFICDFKCNVDWYTWEMLSKLKYKFIFVSQALMGHRIHSKSTTTDIIKNSIRTQEDLIMFKKFWPPIIAKFINKFYVNSEMNNKI